jgi:hypothetical protein
MPTAVIPLEDRSTLVAEEDRTRLVPPEVRVETIQDIRTAVVT